MKNYGRRELHRMGSYRCAKAREGVQIQPQPTQIPLTKSPDAFYRLERNARMERTPRTAHTLLEVRRVLINRFFGCRVTPGSMGTVSEAQKQEGSHKFILVGSINTHSEAPEINSR